MNKRKKSRIFLVDVITVIYFAVLFFSLLCIMSSVVSDYIRGKNKL